MEGPYLFFGIHLIADKGLYCVILLKHIWGYFSPTTFFQRMYSSQKKCTQTSWFLSSFTWKKSCWVTFYPDLNRSFWYNKQVHFYKYTYFLMIMPLFSVYYDYYSNYNKSNFVFQISTLSYHSLRTVSKLTF